MRFGRNTRRASALVMALCLAASGPVKADVTAAPDGSTVGQSSQNSGQGQTGGPSGTTGSSQSGGNGTGSSHSISSSPSRLPSVTATVTTGQSSQSGQGQQTQTGQTAVPQIKSDGAILYDATHKRVLYEKNADKRFYPASITKIMTALLVLENSNFNDTVTFSRTAVTNLESGAVTLGAKEGDQFTVEQCLYGLLLKSANEIANGLAEHVSGSVGAFADRMNQKAVSLGCTNTHFVNPNGLNNSEHYTTARDMALIAEAAFENPVLSKITSTVSYDFPATESVPSVRKLTMGHKMLNPNNAEYYSGIVGGKTGYTSLAGNTLVTCVERNGTRLIVVTLKGRQTHYKDTKDLLDYGFSLAQSGTGSQSSGPGGVQGPGGFVSGNNWVQDSRGWRFVKANGSYAAKECMIINNELYCFKSDSYIVSNDWYQMGGIWYFFRPSGGLAKSRWVETNGKWYYVDGNGSLFTGGTTPDGYRVDQNGVWVQ